jgi:hypothetical protein
VVDARAGRARSVVKLADDLLGGRDGSQQRRVVPSNDIAPSHHGPGPRLSSRLMSTTNEAAAWAGIPIPSPREHKPTGHRRDQFRTPTVAPHRRGIPLAVELAAARPASLSTRDIARRLDEPGSRASGWCSDDHHVSFGWLVQLCTLPSDIQPDPCRAPHRCWSGHGGGRGVRLGALPDGAAVVRIVGLHGRGSH